MSNFKMILRQDSNQILERATIDAFAEFIEPKRLNSRL